jgi:DNA repair protein RadD
VLHQKFLLSVSALAPPPDFYFGPLDPDLFDDGLHWWQFDLLEEVAAAFAAGERRVLLQCPTGAGKTVMALSALLSARQLDMLAMFLVHRKELLRQTSLRFTSSQLDHSFVAADFPFEPDAGLLLAGVQTLIRRLDLVLPPVLVIVDECHHAVSNTYTEILERWPDAFILGLTATPERLDGRGLEEQYDLLIQGPSPAWLIENGFLSPYDYYAPEIPDLTGVPSTAGDFQREAAAAVMNQPKLIGSLVEHYLQYAKGGQGIIFAQNRKHSRKIAEAFNAHGIPAQHVDGDTPKDDRDNFDAAFRAGDIRMGTNVALFGEGYDVPGISYLGIASATKSLINHLQWCGRVLRYVPGKRAVICDHAGNALPSHLGGRGLGLPDDERDWSLLGRAARKAAGKDDTFSITQCLECFRVYPSAAKSCPGCSANRPAAPRVIREQAGKLTKLEREELKKAEQRTRRSEEQACSTYAEFRSLAVARGYPKPDKWAKNRMQMKRGTFWGFR